MKKLLNTLLMGLICWNLLACDNQTKKPIVSAKTEPQALSSAVSLIAQSQPKNEPLDYEAFAKLMKSKQHLTCMQETDCQVVSSIPCGVVSVVNKKYEQAYSDYNAMLERSVDCSLPTEYVKDFQAKCSKQQCQLVHK